MARKWSETATLPDFTRLSYDEARSHIRPTKNFKTKPNKLLESSSNWIERRIRSLREVLGSIFEASETVCWRGRRTHPGRKNRAGIGGKKCGRTLMSCLPHRISSSRLFWLIGLFKRAWKPRNSHKLMLCSATFSKGQTEPGLACDFPTSSRRNFTLHNGLWLMKNPLKVHCKARSFNFRHVSPNRVSIFTSQKVFWVFFSFFLFPLTPAHLSSILADSR